MADMLGFAEIAKRLNLEVTAVRRLIAREGDALGIKIHRGKGVNISLQKTMPSGLSQAMKQGAGQFRTPLRKPQRLIGMVFSTSSS